MGTSNWQNISWCVQAIMRIEPERVLDVGVGFGRWGVLLREFGEVWFGRVMQKDWKIHVEGIEAFEPNLMPYHREFYDKVHVGDALDVFRDMKESWNLIIMGDVLEHFFKPDGQMLLKRALECSDYVMINLPIGDSWPQDDMYGNPYEEHKAVWNLEDFDELPVVAARQFLDFEVRPFAGFVLSRQDPQRLAAGLFGSPKQGEVLAPDSAEPVRSGLSLPSDDRVLLRTIEERLGAVQAIRDSATWKLANRMRNNPLLWRGTSALSSGRGKRIRVTYLGGSRTEAADGVLGLNRISSHGPSEEKGIGSATLWDFLRRSGDWHLKSADSAAFGEQLVTSAPGSYVEWYEHGREYQIRFEVGPIAGRCRVQCHGQVHELDLAREESGEAVFDCRLGQLDIPTEAPADSSAPMIQAPASGELTKVEEAVLERLSAKQASDLTLYTLDWVGVANSSRELFASHHAIPAVLTPDIRERTLRLVEEANLENLILSGGALDHLSLCDEIKRRCPETKIKVLWHGSFLQVREDYAWEGLKRSIELARQEIVHTIGVVKEGMEEFFSDVGIRSALVLNYVDRIPDAPSVPDAGGPHLGIWLSNEGWRKLPYAMAIAARRARANLHVSGASERLGDLCEVIGLPLERHGNPILGPDALADRMKGMHLNLYVTLSECCPMLPLESLSGGTPCLIGPTSHLFRDNEYLYDRLVVPSPDSSSMITEKIQVALKERDEIVRTYARYAVDYNERARSSAARFLEL